MRDTPCLGDSGRGLKKIVCLVRFSSGSLICENELCAFAGEILLDISLFGRTFNAEEERQPQATVTALRIDSSPVRSSVDDQEEQSLSSTDSGQSEVSDLTSELESEPLLRLEPTQQGTVLNQDAPFVREFAEVEKRKIAHGQAIADKLSSIFQKKGKKNTSRSTDSASSSVAPDFSTETLFGAEDMVNAEPSLIGADFSESGEEDEELVPLSFFQDDEKSVGQSLEDLPPPLSGGVLVEQTFAVSMKALNAMLFKPDTAFSKELAEAQKTSELVEGPWKKVGNAPMKRTISYRKAPTRLVKSVVASEVQTYVRADDKGFSVLCSVSTPDVPYGKNFLCELLFVITPGPALPTGGNTSRLHISWRINFLQNTMMNRMIVSGAAQGLKESYIGHQEVLAKFLKPMDGVGGSLENAIEAGPVGKPNTDLELAREYFGNYTVLLTVVGFILVILHIFLAKAKCNGGLQFWYFDFPDSFGELFTVALLTRQVERVGKMVQKFCSARLKGEIVSRRFHLRIGIVFGY